jgi:hypothetical protein
MILITVVFILIILEILILTLIILGNLTRVKVKLKDIVIIFVLLLLNNTTIATVQKNKIPYTKYKGLK